MNHFDVLQEIVNRQIVKAELDGGQVKLTFQDGVCVTFFARPYSTLGFQLENKEAIYTYPSKGAVC